MLHQEFEICIRRAERDLRFGDTAFLQAFLTERRATLKTQIIGRFALLLHSGDASSDMGLGLVVDRGDPLKGFALEYL